MTKHSRGPWSASIGSKGTRIQISDDWHHPLSFGFQYSEGDEEAQANARLIAAAPELLEVCEEFAAVAEYVDGLSDEDSARLTNLYRMTRTVLAKVQGETPAP